MGHFIGDSMLEIVDLPKDRARNKRQTSEKKGIKSAVWLKMVSYSSLKTLEPTILTVKNEEVAVIMSLDEFKKLKSQAGLPYVPTWFKKRQDLLNVLKNNPCQDCGYEFLPTSMKFDYKRLYGLAPSQIIRRFGLEKLKKESSKWDLVCANCYEIREAARR